MPGGMDEEGRPTRMTGTGQARDLTVLLKKARDGSGSAQNELMHRYRERLLERIRMMLGAQVRRHAESIDFLQDVFVHVLKDLDQFQDRSEKEFLRWMTAIARNKIIDASRKKREAAFDSLSDSWSIADQVDSQTPTPSGVIHLRESVHRLCESLERLPAAYLKVVELRDLEGFAYRDIADQMGRGIEAVRKLHARALMELGRQMED
jgi:RNA polymerase sigma-70 factor (ECF subfamily)